MNVTRRSQRGRLHHAPITTETHGCGIAARIALAPDARSSQQQAPGTK